MNVLEEKLVQTGHLRWTHPGGRFVWYVVQPGAPDYKYRFFRDMETLNRTTPSNVTPVAILVDGIESQHLVRFIKKFPRWKRLILGAPGLETEKPMQSAANTASIVIAYGSHEWCSALDEAVSVMEEPPEIITRDLSPPGVEHMPLVQDTDPNSRFWADVERLRHWQLKPQTGLEIRDTVDLRPKFNV